jgi:hypothetical protein
MIVKSKFGARIGSILNDRSYWAVKLKNGEFLSEIDEAVAVTRGERRSLQWYDDIVANGDAANIRELWLFCPAHRRNPLGSTARLPILEPWSCFVLNGASMNVGTGERYPTYQIIGRVLDKASGRCECFIWDHLMQAMSRPYYTSVYDFQPWREGASPIGLLALDRLGLSLK